MKKFILGLILIYSTLIFISCGSTPKPESSSIEDQPALADIENESVDAELPVSRMLVLDNFEDGNYWVGVGDSWDHWNEPDLSLKAELSQEWKADGVYSLKCTNRPAKTNNSKQITWVCYSPIEKDISGFNSCAVDIYNPNPYSYNLRLVIQNNQDWTRDYSKQMLTKQGEHTIIFDLTSFPKEHLSNVFCFMIQNANYETEGTVLYIDNIRLFE